MYLSRVEINLSDSHGRRDVSFPYEMHSTLSRAFSGVSSRDPGPAPFLWRMETVREGGSPVVLVQGAEKPNWETVLERTPRWSQSIETRPIDLGFCSQPRDGLRFRLRANPTVKRLGKRHALLREEEQRAWLIRQGERLGFEPIAFEITDSTRIVARKRSQRGEAVVVHAATWDGLLKVTRPAAFLQALTMGIGHAKFLGLGLLSVAPISR